MYNMLCLTSHVSLCSQHVLDNVQNTRGDLLLLQNIFVTCFGQCTEHITEGRPYYSETIFVTSCCTEDKTLISWYKTMTLFSNQSTLVIYSNNLLFFRPCVHRNTFLVAFSIKWCFVLFDFHHFQYCYKVGKDTIFVM